MHPDTKENVRYYSLFLYDTLRLENDGVKNLVDASGVLSEKTTMSTEDVLDCIVVGIERGVYYPLDNIGLDCQRIKADYEKLKYNGVWYDMLSFYKAVVAELKRVTSLSS